MMTMRMPQNHTLLRTRHPPATQPALCSLWRATSFGSPKRHWGSEGPVPRAPSPRRAFRRTAPTAASSISRRARASCSTWRPTRTNSATASCAACGSARRSPPRPTTRSRGRAAITKGRAFVHHCELVFRGEMMTCCTRIDRASEPLRVKDTHRLATSSFPELGATASEHSGGDGDSSGGDGGDGDASGGDGRRHRGFSNAAARGGVFFITRPSGVRRRICSERSALLMRGVCAGVLRPRAHAARRRRRRRSRRQRKRRR